MRIALVLVCLATAALVQAQAPLVVACQPGLEKYYPLVRAIYNRMGLTCEFLEMPSERALVEVNSGGADAEIGRTENLTSRYPGILYTAEPLLTTGLTGWVLSNSRLQVDAVGDLRAFRIGILRGNKAAEQFVQAQGLSTQSVTTLESLAKMLQANRIDLVIMPEAADPSVLKSVAKKISIGVPHYPVYHLFSKEHQDLVPRWDVVLRAMKANGTYETYLP